MENPDNYLRLCIQCNQLKKFKHSGGRVTGKKCMACYSKKSNLKTNTEKPEYFKSYYENHKDVIKAQAKRNYLKKKNRDVIQLQLLETNDSDETFENLQAEQTFNMEHIVDDYSNGIEERIEAYNIRRIADGEQPFNIEDYVERFLDSSEDEADTEYEEGEWIEAHIVIKSKGGIEV